MLNPEAAIKKVPVQPFNVNYQQELEEERKVNKFCQQTIEYLVEENRILRQQCDNYLTAIRLTTQK